MENKKKTSDYSNGKIYKIVCNKTGLVYTGSTCRELDKRLKEHEYDAKRYLDKNSNVFVSSIYIIIGNDFKIELIENYPCNHKKELQKKEFYYINTIECVNTNRTANSNKNIEYHENMLKLLIDKCGKEAIIKILFRYGIDEYKLNNKK